MILNFTSNNRKIYLQRNNGKPIELKRFERHMVWIVSAWTVKECWSILFKKQPAGVWIQWEGAPVSEAGLTRKIVEAGQQFRVDQLGKLTIKEWEYKNI